MLLCIHPRFNVMLKANWLHQSWGVYILRERYSRTRACSAGTHMDQLYTLRKASHRSILSSARASYLDKLWGARDDCNVAICDPIWSCELRIQFAAIQTGAARHAIRLITTMCTYLLQNWHAFWHEISASIVYTAPEFSPTISPGA